MDIEEILGMRNIVERDETPMARLNASARGADLQERFALLATPNEFKVGDLVQWKAGLKNKKWPRYGEPVLITEIHTGMIDETADRGSPYYREPNDLRFLWIDVDDDCMEFHADSRRFEPFA